MLRIFQMPLVLIIVYRLEKYLYEGHSYCFGDICIKHAYERCQKESSPHNIATEFSTPSAEEIIESGSEIVSDLGEEAAIIHVRSDMSVWIAS